MRRLRILAAIVFLCVCWLTTPTPVGATIFAGCSEGGSGGMYGTFYSNGFESYGDAAYGCAMFNNSGFCSSVGLCVDECDLPDIDQGQCDDVFPYWVPYIPPNGGYEYGYTASCRCYWD